VRPFFLMAGIRILQAKSPLEKSAFGRAGNRER
jgi:hypothetical protein